MSTKYEEHRQIAIIKRFMEMAEPLRYFKYAALSRDDGTVRVRCSFNGKQADMVFEAGAVAVEGRIKRLLEAVALAAIHGGPPIVHEELPRPSKL